MTASIFERLRLDLPVLLPELPDEKDACVGRLVEELAGRQGVLDVHVIPMSGDDPARLCLHYDPDALSVSRIREIAEAAGARLTKRFGHLLLKTDGVRYATRARTVSMDLQRLPGVIEAVATVGGPVRVEFDRELTTETVIRQSLADQGLVVAEPSPPAAKPVSDDDHEHGHEDDHEHGHGGPFGENSELIFAIACGVLLAGGFTFSFMSGLPAWLPLALYLGAYATGGYFPLREAIDTLRAGRFEIDILMLVAAAGAAALDEWAEGALLLFLFSIGHALEHYAMGRARRAITALTDLAPPTAEVRRDGSVREVPIADLAIGETIVIRPNTRIPADGFVTWGSSSVDQAPVTGESVPVDKQPVDDIARAGLNPQGIRPDRIVFAGTINGPGALDVQVTRAAADSTLARLVRMVSEAETQKSPTQRFTDRFEQIFVPVVLLGVGLLLLAWLVIDEPFAASFYRAMAVLVAASPCALAISTPSAVLSGIARAARGGVLVKGGGPLESLGRIAAIAFDKTGTLTEGKPRLTDVIAMTGVTEAELLTVAIAVEDLSDHPLAAAVVRDGRLRLANDAPSAKAEDLRSITGRGLAARIGRDDVFVGKAALFDEVDGPRLPPDLQAQVKALEQQGRTTMVVRRADRYLGVLGLMDTPRANAAEVITWLRTLGISRMIMLSGDNKQVADAVAKQVGLDEARGDLMPDGKVELIKQLRSQQDVAMVGDGVNDAPAMAHASVGIAMGAAGSDVALETADVALMGDELSRLPFVIGLSRQASRTIKQNLWISLGMVAVLVPATLFGLQLGAAVVFHEGSTLLVVANALRLLAYRDPPPSSPL